MSTASERALARRIRRGESRPVEQRMAPGGRVRATSHAWGHAGGKHLLSDPKVPPPRETCAAWSQAERDRFVATGIAPEQPSLFECADADRVEPCPRPRGATSEWSAR